MKLSYYWLVFITLFFGTQAFAEMKHEISVVGVATLYIPVNRLLLDINIKVEGQNSSKVEDKGYQRGIELKKVFQNYGINEQSIINSDMKLHKIREQIDETKEWQDKYFFQLKYSVLFHELELLDAFRKECVKLGADYFSLTEIMNKDRTIHEAKLKTMAFQNAKEKAALIIKGSGIKLGLPISIRTSHVRDYTSDYDTTASYGLSAPKQREPVFQQKKFYITEEISVVFSLEKLVE